MLGQQPELNVSDALQNVLPEDLLPGDILLFRAPEGSLLVNIIFLIQALQDEKHGHYDTTHAAIVVEQGKPYPKIAHVTRPAYVLESLKREMKRRGQEKDRPFLVFRPKDRALAQEMADVAKSVNDQSDRKPAWLVSSAAHLMIPGSGDAHSMKPGKVDESSYCSKFVGECMRIADQNLSETSGHARITRDDAIPSIKLHSSPKMLERYFVERPDLYDRLCFIGRDAYSRVLQEVSIQERRIAGRWGQTSIEKANKLKNVVDDVTREVGLHPEWNELQKVLYLLGNVLPIARERIHKGDFSDPESYQAIVGMARKLGIFILYSAVRTN